MVLTAALTPINWNGQYKDKLKSLGSGNQLTLMWGARALCQHGQCLSGRHWEPLWPGSLQQHLHLDCE